MSKKQELIRQPYLVQRCKTMEFNGSLRTGEYLKLDYMGSAEFEFGAIPKFQRDVNAKLHQLEVHSLTHENMQLWFVAPKHAIEDYGKVLRDLIDNKIRMKERSGLKDRETLYVGKKQIAMYDQPHAPFQYDVWLDLTNGLFFGRTEQAVRNLFITIPNSVRYMDSQARHNT